MSQHVWRSFLLAVGLATSSFPVLAQPLRILCAEIAPLCYQSPRGPTGFIYEIGQELRRRLNRSEPIEIEPLARMWLTTRGDMPVISLWVGRIPEREQLVIWIAPVMTDAFSVYTMKGRPVPKTIEQVRQLEHIGTNISGANEYASMLHKLGNTRMYSSDNVNGRMLLYGRLDGWIATQVSVRGFLRENNRPDDTIVRGFKLMDYVAYLAASRSVSDAEATRWKAALLEMQRDGSYRRILDKYGSGNVDVRYRTP